MMQRPAKGLIWGPAKESMEGSAKGDCSGDDQRDMVCCDGCKGCSHLRCIGFN